MKTFILFAMLAIVSANLDLSFHFEYGHGHHGGSSGSSGGSGSVETSGGSSSGGSSGGSSSGGSSGGSSSGGGSGGGSSPRNPCEDKCRMSQPCSMVPPDLQACDACYTKCGSQFVACSKIDEEQCEGFCVEDAKCSIDQCIKYPANGKHVVSCSCNKCTEAHPTAPCKPQLRIFCGRICSNFGGCSQNECATYKNRKTLCLCQNCR